MATASSGNSVVEAAIGRVIPSLITKLAVFAAAEEIIKWFEYKRDGAA
ncbi:MAG: hypothetical protein ACSLEM_01455 [Candidatus Malihini olakiniferum]